MREESLLIFENENRAYKKSSINVATIYHQLESRPFQLQVAISKSIVLQLQVALETGSFSDGLQSANRSRMVSTPLGTRQSHCLSLVLLEIPPQAGKAKTGERRAKKEKTHFTVRYLPCMLVITVASKISEL